jgi:hypothetical protein
MDDFVLPSLKKKPELGQISQSPEFTLPLMKNAAPSTLPDVGVGAVSGLQRGVYGIPEVLQETSNLIESIPGRAVSGGIWAGEKLGAFPSGTSEQFEKSTQNIRDIQSEWEKKHGSNRLPSLKDVTSTAESVGIPTSPRPKTTLGKITEAGAQALPLAVVGPGTAIERGLTQFASGAASEAAGLATQGTPYETFSRIVGGLGGGAAIAGPSAMIRAKSPENIEEIGSQLAGKAARESFVQPNAAEASLATPSPSFVSGVEPTTAQTLQIKGAEAAAKQAQALAQKVTGIKDFENTAEAQALRNQMETSEQNLAAQAELTAQQASAVSGKPIDISTSFGISGTSPQGDASIQVRNMIAALDKRLDEQAKSAWKDPQLEAAGVYKNKTVNELTNYLDNLSQAKRAGFPSEITKVLENISSMEGSQIPFNELQDLRSMTLAQARKAYTSPNVVDAPALYGFANKIGEVLSNPQNIRFGNTYGEIEAWNKARAATKQYYDTFGDGFLANMVNNEKISPEMTLKNLYTGSSGPNNLRELRNVFGDQADKSVSDWMVGELTNNGSNLNITPDKVTKFISDPKNSAIIQEVPGLSERLQSIAQRAGESAEQSQMRQFSNSFENIVNKNNPKALASFLDSHPDMIEKVFPTADQQKYVQALRDSAKAISKIGNAKLIPNETLKNLTENNMFTLLYGRATGALSDTVVGALAGHALEGATNIAGAGPVGGALSLLGVGKRAVPAIFNKANDWVFGGTREEAIRKLQAAASDPQLMQALLNKPDPNGWSRLGNALINVAGRSAIPVVESSNREFRKSGGRAGVMSAQQLLRDLKRRQAMMAHKTEQMLSLPDDAIVQALDAAKR